MQWIRQHKSRFQVRFLSDRVGKRRYISVRAKEFAVKTYYVYTAEDLDYVGTLEATDMDVAQALAGAIWGGSVTITTQRLTDHLAVQR